MSLALSLGLKSDPIEYRYSFPWLFRLLEEEGVHDLQIGTFYELYELPEAFFGELRAQAADHGIRIRSIFTAHRELGGLFREETGFQEVAKRAIRNLIHAGAMVGAECVGWNPGAIMRDRMGYKAEATRVFLDAMPSLMTYAADLGVGTLSLEPMSCLAEPPTLPDEIRAMCEELNDVHARHPQSTCRVGLCLDIAHGYCDASRRVVFDHIELIRAALPYTVELHLKNTDAIYNSTFGFSEKDRERGVVDLAEVRDLLLAHADQIPVDHLVGYLEMGGPKTGRDYTDGDVGDVLRASLAHCREVFPVAQVREPARQAADVAMPKPQPSPSVELAPSMMCADMLHMEDEVRRLERAGVEMLHFDLMDAHFTPNMPVGLVLLEQLRRATPLPFDVHLMVDDNDRFVSLLRPLGVQMVSVHAESCLHADRTLATIREMGARAGLALNPSTPLSVLEYLLDRLDFILVMCVNPGFAGQSLVPATLAKISECRTYLEERGYSIPIQVDGNVSLANIPAMVAAGADILVCGTSSIFRKGGSIAGNVALTRAATEEGLALR